MPNKEISNGQEGQIIDFIKARGGKVFKYPGNLIGRIDSEPIVILHDVMVSATGNPTRVVVDRLLSEKGGTTTLICSDKHAEWIEQAGIVDFTENLQTDEKSS